MAPDESRPPRARGGSRLARQRAFLEVFAQVGVISAAADAAGVHRSMHWDWLRDDPTYQARFEEANRQATDVLEAEARRRAVEGWDEPVFQKGEQCGVVRRYDSSLLVLLLKGKRPREFRDNSSLELSGPDGKAISIDVRASDVLEKLRAFRGDKT